MYSNFFGCCLQYFFLFFFVLLVFELICFFFLSLFPSRRTHCTISVLLKYSSVVVHIIYYIYYMYLNYIVVVVPQYLLLVHFTKVKTCNPWVHS